jgi:hypothetical protein
MHNGFLPPAEEDAYSSAFAVNYVCSALPRLSGRAFGLSILRR